MPGVDERWEELKLVGYSPEGPEDMNERYIWAHQYLIRDLLAAAEVGTEPIASAHRAATALEMIMATYESHFSGRRVVLPLTNREHPLELLSAKHIEKEVALSV